jgi:hypothetical protein
MLEKEVSKPIGLSWKSKDQLQEDWCHKVFNYKNCENY